MITEINGENTVVKKKKREKCDELDDHVNNHKLVVSKLKHDINLTEDTINKIDDSISDNCTCWIDKMTESSITNSFSVHFISQRTSIKSHSAIKKDKSINASKTDKTREMEESKNNNDCVASAVGKKSYEENAFHFNGEGNIDVIVVDDKDSIIEVIKTMR